MDRDLKRAFASAVVVLAVAGVVAFAYTALYPVGSPRSIVGFVLLGVAVLAPLAALAVARGRLGRPLSSTGSGLLAIAAALVPLAAALVLLLPPQITVDLTQPKPVVAQEQNRVDAAFRNSGIIEGTWNGGARLDGRPLPSSAVRVKGRGSAVSAIELPASLSPGDHVLEVANARIEFRALRPPHFVVSELSAEPEDYARTGQVVTVTAIVENTGEVEGRFEGALEAGSGEVSGGAPVPPGEKRFISYEFRPKEPGKYRLRLEGSAAPTLTVVRPVRPRTGTVLARDTSGVGVLKFTNKSHADCLVFLTRTAKARRPALCLYSRAGSTCKVSGIGDGAWYVSYASGTYWNTTTKTFLETDERSRFRNPVSFSTARWTSSYVDYSANVRYITDHTNYTLYEIRISDDLVWGPKGGVVEVSASAFPRM
jgi:hypothetical protein